MGEASDRPVERAVDRDRLLPGEDPKSQELDDAEHWLRVYEELHRFKEGLIAATRARLGELPAEARSEINDVDLAMMTSESERLAGRMEFWRARVHDLMPARRD
jgi:hypothetical protein